MVPERDVGHELVVRAIPSGAVISKRQLPVGTVRGGAFDASTIMAHVHGGLALLRVDDARTLHIYAVGREDGAFDIAVHDGVHFTGSSAALRYRRGGWLEPDFADLDATPGLRQADLIGAFFAPR
jgi:hypothetical protein